jgi:hypothetical protein
MDWLPVQAPVPKLAASLISYVFLLYSLVNIEDVHARGGTLNGVWTVRFFNSLL